MKKAIKNNPRNYNGKRVSVAGEVVKKYTSSSSSGGNYITLSISTVEVYLSDKLKFSVVEKGDILVVDGVIYIQEDGTIQMRNASYTLKNYE